MQQPGGSPALLRRASNAIHLDFNTVVVLAVVWKMTTCYLSPPCSQEVYLLAAATSASVEASANTQDLN